MSTRRTQPLRRGTKRKQTAALKASQKGRPPTLFTTGMKRRAALRKKRRRSKTPRDPLMEFVSVRRRKR